ncbi:excinuclease ABC subunit UvrA [Cloacibacterium normanense]|uniref:UvrABC system protein A n=1 Tax=Cloacibacterium normanense TaxID=237258 RepID=A0A1E5UEA1_9FLAO|nr:excinuclease ABC subunit UvrA [Cloacibacterium normanense]AZI69278.1 excinuclease ABC subunit UvrA [Cloacibacterium normanense]OEL10995.1 excinuclease ABC subunit A [Cloacibacterium normanense]SDO66371.1 excinuclease ABC subunit A [Cloacibacterium normanense]
MSTEKEYIEIYGAREHNLKNINVKIPRNELVTITGLSGSGKSSLAFDTIFAEGQRRYIETFSAYARQFLGGLERPDVDKIEGLSPVIAIEQKTTNKNPRSTVGTVTELYDFLRLLFARVSDAYSLETGQKMVSYTEEQILETIKENYKGEKVLLLAPVVRSRKGHYHELFVQLAKKGYSQARIDGELQDIEYDLKLDRYKTHDIEVVIDRWIIGENATESRMAKSLKTALQMGEGVVMVQKLGATDYQYFSKNLMDAHSGNALPIPEPNTFSFNSPKGSCPTCKGLGTIKKINEEFLVENPNFSINQGALLPLEVLKGNKWLLTQIKNILEIFGLGLNTSFNEIPREAVDYIYYGCQKEFTADLKYAGISKKIKINFEGLVPYLSQVIEDKENYDAVVLERQFTTEETCPECNGARLQKSSLAFKIDGKNIAEINALSLLDLKDWIQEVKEKFSEKNKIIANEILKEIETRLQFLLDVGLDYLSLSRSSRTLSGGESQRIRLATQIGSQLVNVLYILDEPSIGLHQRDNERLINSLKNLRDIGNSVLVVEHDKDMILEADYVLDIGPRAGKHGGEILWQGKPKDLIKANTITADYLTGKRSIEIPKERRKGNGKFLKLKGATGNNLKNVNLEIPLGKLVVVTGISGSGKSSLINGTLYPILNKHFYRAIQEPLPYKKFEGIENIDKIVDVDQTPIGRTPRSNPATYTGMFTDIRNLFAELPESKIRGYKAGRFSFNVKGGRCETCQGGGLKVIEMNFLPDVYVHCETCNGKRFNRETLEVRYKGKSISDVLEMTIDEAVDFFQPIPKIYAKVKTLQDVGLGYITLGQQSTTLSGGEAQRIKLATELAKKQTGNTLYILDEPTTGLHFEDVKILMEAIKQLVELGNSFIIIEHNLDVIKLADHIIDIGPEGGKHGGEIIATGTPEELIKSKKSLTAKFLKKEME